MTVNSSYENPRGSGAAAAVAYNVDGSGTPNRAQAQQQQEQQRQQPHKRPEKEINLKLGWPSPSFLPANLLAESAQRLLSDPALYTEALEYGLDRGHLPLRRGLASWLGRHYGVAEARGWEPDPERICVTGGASQNIARVLQCYADPAYTRAVWIIAPCFFLACSIFEDGGFAGKLRASPEDEEGLDISALERKMRALDDEVDAKPAIAPIKKAKSFTKFYKHIIYAVPTCANPSGRTMTLRRREALVRLARRHDALIIADDVYDFLQWDDAEAEADTDAAGAGVGVGVRRTLEMRLPRLCDVDRAMGPCESDPRGFGHAVSNGSFSKVAGPGVRTGWLEASRAFAWGLGQAGTTVSGGPPSHFTAAVMSGLVAGGALERRIDEQTRAALRRRRRLMMDALGRYMFPLGASCRDDSLAGTSVRGGYFLWVKLPDGVAAGPFAAAAAEEENVAVAAGGLFEVAGDDSVRFGDHCRLCFAYVEEEDLVEAVRRLGGLLKRMQVRG